MKRIAIIGANESITILINKAKELGYETHVFAWKCGDPGEEVADFFYPISIDEKEKILEKCKELNICGICSITSDFASPTVNYIARKLGLNCNLEIADQLARDKYKMRCAFEKSGIYTPKFIEVDDSFCIDKIRSYMEFPVIVKPTDRWSSKGVTRVNKLCELKSAIENAVKESLNGKAIIEEFVEGDEYSAEYICFNGEYRVLAITKKYTTGYPHYIETAHYQPVILPYSFREESGKVFSIALRALGIINGAAHIEFKIMKDGKVCIIEIGARMGGDFIGTHLTPISTGFDYVKMVIDVACGNPPDFKKISNPTNVEVRFIITEKDYFEMCEIKNKNNDVIIEVGNIDSNFTKDVVDSNTRHGHYIVKVGEYDK